MGVSCTFLTGALKGTDLLTLQTLIPLYVNIGMSVYRGEIQMDLAVIDLALINADE
ncbi:MAG: hypothetical protein P8Q37_09930 [Porticoccaceae bacterium]|nr:hypothetical protein [Porticoccaceae bacterium]MDG1475213.1 hypothetical protein [Porticoccaceae bacterium]